MTHPPSLRRLLAWLVGCALLPAFVVVTLAWRAERAKLQEGAREQIESVATLVALHEQRRFEGARQLLTVATAAPVVQSMEPPNATATC